MDRAESFNVSWRTCPLLYVLPGIRFGTRLRASICCQFLLHGASVVFCVCKKSVYICNRQCMLCIWICNCVCVCPCLRFRYRLGHSRLWLRMHPWCSMHGWCACTALHTPIRYCVLCVCMYNYVCICACVPSFIRWCRSRFRLVRVCLLFTRLFRLLVHSFVYLLVGSFCRPYVCAFVRLFARLFVNKSQFHSFFLPLEQTLDPTKTALTMNVHACLLG